MKKEMILMLFGASLINVANADNLGYSDYYQDLQRRHDEAIQESRQQIYQPRDTQYFRDSSGYVREYNPDQGINCQFVPTSYGVRKICK